MSLNFDTLFGPYADTRFTINYDWIDVDSATGYVGYDVVDCDTSAASFAIMEKSSERYNLWSNNTNTVYSLASASLTKTHDVDCDTSIFKKERTIEGTAYFKATIGEIYGSGSANTSDIYLIFKVRKWNGTSETDIVSVQTQTKHFVPPAPPTPFIDIFSTKLTIPKTVIAVGEQIRITVEVWVTASNDSTVYVLLYHDPQSSVTTYNQRLVYTIPFKIETGN